jgi:hypothetical protein
MISMPPFCNGLKGQFILAQGNPEASGCHGWKQVVKIVRLIKLVVIADEEVSGAI